LGRRAHAPEPSNRLLVARESLPSLIDRAANRLLSARSSAELLEVMEFVKMAQAYARLIKASNESHADCVLLIKTARLRFADEIDRGQAKGQIAKREDTLRVGPVRHTSANGTAGIDEVVSHQRLTEWRQVRKAGGLALVRGIIAKALGEDRAPTDAEILREAKKRLRQAENDALRAIAAPLPLGRYGTIVIDPPWEMQKIDREVRPNQAAFDYPTMTEDELANFPVGNMAAEDCHLFCWTTQKHLLAAVRLIEVWGFKPCLVMVWHKAGGFQPVGLPQFNCEFIVYGRRGPPKFIDTKNFYCCVTAKRREHSRKPDEFYDVIRRVTAESRIDVFSREARESFAQYGNETKKFARDFTHPQEHSSASPDARTIRSVT
jgi:N6-adenosine-specific RNA methylase IME4